MFSIIQMLRCGVVRWGPDREEQHMRNCHIYAWDTQSLARLYTFDASRKHFTPHTLWHGLLLQGIPSYSIQFLSLKHEVWNSRNYWHFCSQAFRKLFPKHEMQVVWFVLAMQRPGHV